MSSPGLGSTRRLQPDDDLAGFDCGAAADFYRRFGFLPLPDNHDNLYVLVKDLRASVAEAGRRRVGC